MSTVQMREAGDIVTWGIEGGGVTADKAKTEGVAAGLPESVFKKLDPRVIFDRSVTAMGIFKKGKGKSGILIEEVGRTGNVKLYQLTDEANDGRSIRHSEKCFITLDVYTATTTCTDQHIGDTLADEMRRHADMRTNQDLTYLAQKLFRQNADLFPINRKKGVAYFVPTRHCDFADKVERFIVNVGGWIDRWPIQAGTDRGGRAIRKTVNGGMESLLAELEYSIGLFDGDTRSGTVKRKIRDYRTAKAKIEAYSEFLSGSQSELLTRAAGIQKQLEKKMTELT